MKSISDLRNYTELSKIVNVKNTFNLAPSGSDEYAIVKSGS